MTDERSGSALSDDELQAYLQSRIPTPATGYWDEIDRSLNADAGTAVSSDEDYEQSVDTDDDVVRPLGMKKTQTSENDAPTTGSPTNGSPSWMTNRNLLAAAAIVFVVALGIFALTRSGDDTVDLATASQGQTDADNPASSADIERDLSPLRAVQARLTGQVAGDADGAGGAGPYCFTSDDAYVFPADELDDRRALAWLDIASDGTISYAALQGDSIAISGSGVPSVEGVLISRPTVFGAASGALPPYTVTIADTAITFAPENSALELVPCAGVADRVETMFSLPPTAVADPIGASADWPPADAVLSSAGLGPIKIGMNVSELSTVLGTELTFETLEMVVDPTRSALAGDCGLVSSSAAVTNDVVILVEVLTGGTDAIIRRVSVSDGRWSTPSGISVGMTEQNVLDTFPGQIESEPHIYVEGTYLTYQPADVNDPNTVQFVNEGGTIVTMHAGDWGWVGLAESCA